MNVEPMRPTEAPPLKNVEQAASPSVNWPRALGWYGLVPGAAIAVYGTAFLVLARLISL